MTLQDCYNQNQGHALLIPGGGAGNDGQCVQWADTVLHDVYGFDYIYSPAAKDWWELFDTFPQLVNNFHKVSDDSVKAGDFIVYGTGVGPYGHIDVAAADGSLGNYTGYDSNWGGAAFKNAQGFPILHTVHHADSYNQYILGALRLKGGFMYSPDDWHGDLVNLWKADDQHDPTGADFTAWNQPGDFKTLFYKKVIPDFQSKNTQIATLTQQVSDLQNKLSATPSPTPPVDPATPPTPDGAPSATGQGSGTSTSEPTSVTITKDSLWAKILKFLSL